jgi:tetratricopeptide (TPR) repeat protein
MVTWLLERTARSAASFAPRGDGGPGDGGRGDGGRGDGGRGDGAEGPDSGGDQADGADGGGDQIDGRRGGGGPADPDDDHGAASAWLDREAPNWVAALRQAAAAGRHAEVVAVTRSLHWYSDTTSHRHPWDELFGLGVDAARAVGDRAGEAVLLNFLGWALYFCRDRMRNGLTAHRRAFHLAREIGDPREKAWALAYTAAIAVRVGHPRLAVAPSLRAAALFRSIGYGLGEQTATGVLGTAQAALGDHEEALTLHRRILTFHRDSEQLSRTGRLVAQGATTLMIGHDLGHLGRWVEAVRTYAEATELFRRAGDPYGQAEGAYRRALALAELGDLAAARAGLGQALELFTEMGSAPWRDRVRAALAGLGTPRDGVPAPGTARDPDAERPARWVVDG